MAVVTGGGARLPGPDGTPEEYPGGGGVCYLTASQEFFSPEGVDKPPLTCGNALKAIAAQRNSHVYPLPIRLLDNAIRAA